MTTVDKMMNTKLNLTFQLNRLFNFGLNRKKFQINSTPEKFFALNNSKNTFIAMLLTLFSCGLLFTGILEVINHEIEITLDFIIVFFFIHFGIGLLGLRQFLWLINGRQEMTIENDLLTIINKGTFLSKSKTYSLNLVTNIRQETEEKKESLNDEIKHNIKMTSKIMFRQTFGQLLFDYNGKSVKVFNDLDKKERNILIQEIASWRQNQPITAHLQ